MNVFFLSITGTPDGTFDKIKPKLDETFGGNNIFQTEVGSYFIASDNIIFPKNIAEKIDPEFSTGILGNFFILPVSAYWGFYSRELWNWLELKGI